MHIETAFMSTYYVCRSGIGDRAGSYFTITLEHLHHLHISQLLTSHVLSSPLKNHGKPFCKAL